MFWLLKTQRPAPKREDKRLWIEMLAEIDPRYRALLHALQDNDRLPVDPGREPGTDGEADQMRPHR